MKIYKLHFNFTNIGDQVSVTAIPENIFHYTGEKCVISDDRIWSFKYNPYVINMPEQNTKGLPIISLMPDCRIKEQAQKYFNIYNFFSANSQTEYMCASFDLLNVKLRHSRLYIYEDEKIKPDRIIVHTTGSDRTKANEVAIRTDSGEDDVRVMSDNIMASVLKNYRDYEIVQIGAKNDKLLGAGVKDMRGALNYWEAAQLIASSGKFIGVNSGPMHIANCYPRVEKRIVLQEFSAETLMKFRPGDIRNWLFSWIDPTCIFFNKFEYDIGYSYSYTKI